ncbi:LysR family transcriptional regulator [Paraburkholderia acidisoli]|uniref:LysR family transcriptional regulator n=1 Tax=Paraburkholderia acidisoli TaxID=2571748 RepID=A0A7Z2JK82_9BURK|nr:LysR family transcriptional regulator [Paraburkholderia acidisoli]QGZ67028.1 LysR family transcriptional regulator [Paraburkholderia acidisoli]
MALGYSLKQLEAFAAVAALGSFTAAAEKLNMSRAALSATIDALEESLGTRLFNRKRSIGISLTSTGQEFLLGANSLLNDARRLARTVKASDDLQGELTVGATASLASTAVPVFIEQLAKQHPRLSVRVIVRGADELLSLLEVGGVELLFSYVSSTAARKLETIRLFSARLGVMAPRGRYKATSGRLNARKLIGQPIAVLDNAVSLQRLFAYLEEAKAADIAIRYRVGALPICTELVRRGVATAIVPILPALLNQLPADIECFELEPPSLPNVATVTWPAGTSLSPAADASVAILRALWHEAD